MATTKKTESNKPTTKKTITKKPTSVKKTITKKAASTKSVAKIVKSSSKKAVNKTKKTVAKKIDSKPEIKKVEPVKVSKKAASKKTKSILTSSVFLWVIFVVILAAVIGYVNYKNSVDAVNEYYSTNDSRRAESTYQEFVDESPKSRIVMTEFDMIRPTFSLVQESTRNNEQIFVETFYLKRTSPIDFKVTKSFRNIVSGQSFDEVVKLAVQRDLHLDNPDETQTDIISVRDLDLTPEQQIQAAEQRQAQEEQQRAQEEYEALPTEGKIERLNEQINDIEGFITAIENGEATYNDQEIPAGVDVGYLQQVLSGTQAEIDRLQSELSGEGE